MKKGDEVSVMGPFGWFKIRDSFTPIIMIAGGVGITPIRALLKKLEADNSRPIELIYSSSDYFLFEDEIKNIANNNPNINFKKNTSKNETTKTLESLIEKYNSNGFYYISGSRKFIDSYKKLIKSKDIKSNRIIIDPFIGY